MKPSVLSRGTLPVVLFCCVVAGDLFGDILVMKNGNRFEGEVLEQTDTQVVLKMKFGTMTFPRAQIKEIKKVKKRTPPPAPKAPEVPDKPTSKPDAGAGAIVPPPPPPAKPGQYGLQYSPEGFPMGLATGQGNGLHLTDTASQGQFKKLPPETGATRSYGELSVAGQPFLVMVEESKPAKFYLDANKNGDLTDDPGPFPGEKDHIVANHYALKLPYEGEERPVSYRMWAFGSRMGGVRFYAKCHWHSTLSLNGKRYKMVLFDGTPDCDYSNEPLVIDLNGDGKAQKTEQLRVGQALDVEGTKVTLEAIAPSGRRVRLTF